VKPNVLAVFAHPDDEFTVAPLLARCAAEGHGTYLASFTSGQKGSAAHAKIGPGAALGAVREEELRRAAAELGIAPPFLLGFEDQGISQPRAAAEAAERLREIIARVRPGVLITFGPDGLTGHPDHRAASNIATEVFQQRGRLAYAPRKLYYTVLPESLFAAVPPPFDARLRTTSDRFVTTAVDCRGWLDAAYAAIRCHATQWTPERMAQFDHVNRAVLAGRVYLRLAMQEGPPVAALETHIFERA